MRALKARHNSPTSASTPGEQIPVKSSINWSTVHSNVTTEIKETLNAHETFKSLQLKFAIFECVEVRVGTAGYEVLEREAQAFVH
jgi:hypothetical protein